MFGGEEERVTLRCTNDMANVIIDQFGCETKLIKVDDEHLEAKVDVVASNQFFGWIVGIGGGVKVASPKNVKKQFNDCMNKF